MNLKSYFKIGRFSRRSAAPPPLFTGGMPTTSLGTASAMRLGAVYRCVEVISDSLAQLPLEPYRLTQEGYKEPMRGEPLHRLLNAVPNERMSRFTFIKVLATSMLLTGNAYAWIERGRGATVKALHYIPTEFVTIRKPASLTEPVTYDVRGLGLVKASDMVHILNFSYDGVTGLSTLRHAALTLGLANDAESHARGFFAGGCNVGGILTVQGTLQDEQAENLKEQWSRAFRPGTGIPNGVAVLEGNMTYAPVTVNPSDSQLLETRAFEVVDICRFFGVSPVKVFDLSKSSYATVEATQLAFLTDTLAPIMEKMELEFERKLFPDGGVDVRFDTSGLLRVDKGSMANYFSRLFAIGAVSPNEVRRELDLPRMEGGDDTFVQVNMQKLKEYANQGNS